MAFNDTYVESIQTKHVSNVGFTSTAKGVTNEAFALKNPHQVLSSQIPFIDVIGTYGPLVASGIAAEVAEEHIVKLTADPTVNGNKAWIAYETGCTVSGHSARGAVRVDKWMRYAETQYKLRLYEDNGSSTAPDYTKEILPSEVNFNWEYDASAGIVYFDADPDITKTIPLWGLFYTYIGGTVEEAIITAANSSPDVSYLSFDCTYIDNYNWSYDSGGDLTEIPASLSVFVNGVKQRDDDPDYYTATILAGVINLEFGFKVKNDDWVNIEYLSSDGGSGGGGGASLPDSGTTVNVLLVGDGANGFNVSTSALNLLSDTTLNGPASTTVAGPVELATDQETIDGVDIEKAVTPSGLTSRLASPGIIGDFISSDAYFNNIFLVDGITTTSGLTVTGREITETNLNKHLVLLDGVEGPEIIRHTYYWDDFYNDYILNESYFFGLEAGSFSSGSQCNGFGYGALEENRGHDSDGFGALALYDNSGDRVYGFGHGSLSSNSGDNCIGVGYYTLSVNNWPNVIHIGNDIDEVYYFSLDEFTSKTFTDEEITENTITFLTPHGFGVVGKGVNLLLTTISGTAPTGTYTNLPMKFRITSSTQLVVYSRAETIGTDASVDFVGKLTNSVDTSNSITIGNNVNATKANQVIIGSDAVTETVLRGEVLAGELVTTSGIKITGGSPAVGKILVSDVDGNGSWEEVTVSGGGGIADVSDDTSPQLGGDLDTNEKNIILVPTLTTDQHASGLIAPMTCGETTAFGNVGYVKSDEKLWLSSATSATTMPAIAMALEFGSANDSKNWLFQGFVRNDGWDWAVGGLVYVDIVAGGITQTTVTGTENQAQVIGVALTSDSMIFNPSYVLVEVV